MKKLKVGYVFDKDKKAYPVLFSNACLLFWSHKTGTKIDTLIAGDVVNPYEQLWLFYSGMKHGYEQDGDRCPWTFDDFSESAQFDDKLMDSFMEEFKDQMFAKAKAMGIDLSKIEEEIDEEEADLEPVAAVPEIDNVPVKKRLKKKAS